MRGKKNKPGAGAPTLYKTEYCDKIIKFFDVPHSKIITIRTTGKNDYVKEEEKEIANALPHLIQFARQIGVSHDAISDWAKKYPDFAEALSTAKKINEQMLASNALKGLYNSTFSIFMAKNKFGWRDEQHLKTESKDEKTLNINLDGIAAGDLKSIIEVSRARAL